jgi:hypothetical protein
MHKRYYTEVFKEICYEEGRTCYSCTFFLGVNSLEVEIQPISETHYKSQQFNKMNLEMLTELFVKHLYYPFWNLKISAVLLHCETA